jgi:predicted dehydrogenase
MKRGMGKIRLAIIGCGGMARGHLRAYEEIMKRRPDLFEISATCDPEIGRASSFAERAEGFQGKRPRVYGSVEEMLREEELDAADICTPHFDHHISGVACLEAGVNVLIEKPFGVTVKASKKIIEAAERSGKIAATAENIRRGPNQRTAWWAINERKLIGSPRIFYAIHAGWSEPNPKDRWHWRLDKFLGGGGMVMDSGAHFCDTMRYLFGDVDYVFARVEMLERRSAMRGDIQVPNSVEDTWIATLCFKNGMIGVWSWTRSAPGHEFTKVVYYGSDGALLDSGDVFHGPFEDAQFLLKDGTSIPMKDLRKEFLDGLSEQERDRLFPFGFMDGVVLECYDFLDAIATGRKPEVDGVDGMKAKAISEAIFESAWSKEPVRVDDVIEGKVEGFQKEINERWGL